MGRRIRRCWRWCWCDGSGLSPQRDRRSARGRAGARPPRVPDVVTLGDDGRLTSLALSAHHPLTVPARPALRQTTRSLYCPANPSTSYAALTTTAHGGIVADTDARLTNDRIPTSHDNTKHSTAYAAAADLTSHTGATAPHTGHVQVAGQLGGTAASPTVLGIRETAGPTLLTVGAVADGETVKRSGSTLIGYTPTGGSGLTHPQVMARSCI